MSQIINALQRSARADPHRRAVSGSDVSLTRAQLEAEVLRLARSIDRRCVLGSLMTNSPGWIVTDLAALHAAAPHIPLPPFFSDEQIRYALQDAGVNTVLTDDPDRIGAIAPVLYSESILIAGHEYARLRLQAAGQPVDSAIAKVTYTSGTTAAPRGVCLSIETIEQVAGALACATGANNHDRALALLPLAILLENIATVYVPLLCGAEILVPDPADSGIHGSSQVDPERLANILQQCRPTALVVPPGLLKLLIALAGQGLIPDSLRFIAVGGAPVGRALLDAAAAHGLPVYQGYGLSEAGSVVALNTPQGNRPGSVGRLLPHLSAEISESGEILVGGQTFTGYLGQAERRPGEVLATGDTGFIDEDGYLYVTGRMRERIITAYGRNVSPEWIEAELTAHADIAQAAVIGDGQRTLQAVLVPATGSHLPLAEAVAGINLRLPDYARIDSWLAANAPFTAANGLATVSGSPRRAKIRQQYFGQQQASGS